VNTVNEELHKSICPPVPKEDVEKECITSSTVYSKRDWK